MSNKDEKAQKNWLETAKAKIKAMGISTALLLSGSATHAAAQENSASSSDEIQTEIQVKNTPSKEDVPTLNVQAKDFRAYPGNYYNEICNGSPCWLSSTLETNGAGIGKKVSSVATFSNDGTYRGLNQISPGHAQKFLQWLGTQNEHKGVYVALKNGGLGKTNWQAVAKKMEHPMTAAFEDYMVEQYAPENFKAIQKILNTSNVAVSVKKLHPAILSAIHQRTVQRPAWRSDIAKKMINFVNAHNGDAHALNSEEFINILYPTPPKGQKDTYGVLRKRAITLLNDSSINWKQEQFVSLVSQAVPTNDDGRSWFDEQAEKQTEKNIEKPHSVLLAEEMAPSIDVKANINPPDTLQIDPALLKRTQELKKDMLAKASKKLKKGKTATKEDQKNHNLVSDNVPQKNDTKTPQKETSFLVNNDSNLQRRFFQKSSGRS